MLIRIITDGEWDGDDDAIALSIALDRSFDFWLHEDNPISSKGLYTYTAYH